MQSLAKAALRPDASGTPLPDVYQSLRDAGIRVRAGELTLIAAAPGTGKSSIAEDLAVKMGVPGLYFSCDSDAWTMATRLASMRSGRLLADEEQMLNMDPDYAAEVLSSADHLRWVFESSPSLADIDLEIDAYTEVMGVPPRLVVIDNLMDVVYEGETDTSAWRAILRELKWLARDTGAAVVVLHHTKEGDHGYGQNEPPCPPRRAIQGLVSQLPALILTLGGRQPGHLAVCAVKNRHGKADPTGADSIWLTFDPASMQISDNPYVRSAT